ncbi:hypothetical protein [Tianweitania sediminis]|uniref:ribonucleoside-diphosphate reductase n=1 Tax=Tianweitania sediminis TaxID=1502156 RepID=A0A8J7R9B9_9HYPH|nr:hypothetical protein [Tianweitania sediminis]MBP0440667.1 hypothetical protein [Tianweitania sediminis]
MTREIIPQRRASENEEIAFAGTQVSVSFGYYDDGRVAEVFLSTRKAGSAVDVAARDTAVLMSLLLQYGCSAKIIGRAITADAQGRPEGLAGIVARLVEERQAERVALMVEAAE